MIRTCSVGVLLLLAVVLPPGLPVRALEPLTPESDTAFQNGVHAWYGCESCHLDGLPDRIPRSRVPAICGDCHKAPREDYAQSVHWGEGKAHAVCIDCHGVHGILPVANPASKAHRSRVCATCHPGPMDQLERGPHAAAFAASEALICASCHSNHRVVRPTLAALEPACAICHPAQSDPFRMGQSVGAAFQSVRDSLGLADALIDSARAQDLTVRTAEREIASARTTFTQARLVWHALDREAISEFTESAQVQIAAGLDAAQNAFDTRNRRRIVLAAIWLAVVVNVTLLYLKLKRADRDTV